MEQQCQKIWRECLEVIRANINQESFDTWFAPIIPLAYTNNILTIRVKSNYVPEHLDSHYPELLRAALNKVLGPHSKLAYSVVQSVNSSASGDIKIPSREPVNPENPTVQMPVEVTKDELPNPFAYPGLKRIKIESQLNSEYTFDNFIEGDCNRLARSAGYAAAERPGKSAFNPIFIYSAPGLGKTHLLHAIGLEIKRRYPDKIVLYVNMEQFVVQFMSACRNTNQRNDFIRFYQMMDVLIVDDVQFLIGKPGSQETFYQIFNHLQINGKQLVFASDKSPSDLKELQPRLLSRFKWGLIADLQMPDVETRKNILRKKAFNQGMTIPDKVIDYIAENIQTNIREMDGLLVSLIAQSVLNRKAITVDLAKQIINDFTIKATHEVSVDYIINVVCQNRNVNLEDFNTLSRKRNIVQARQLAMYFCKKYTKASLNIIGSQCGNKDHATVLHSIRAVENMIDTDNEFRQIVKDIEKNFI